MKIIMISKKRNVMMSLKCDSPSLVVTMLIERGVLDDTFIRTDWLGLMLWKLGFKDLAMKCKVGLWK